MADPLDAAKARLQAALLQGQGTAAIRAEVAKLAEKEAVQARKSADAEAKQRRDHEAGIADRTEAILDQAAAGIAALINRHPIPNKTA